MSKERLDPPRQSWETAHYEEDPFELGEIDEAKLKVVSKDFLPRPEELVFRPKPVRVTLTLDADTVAYFKAEADRLHVSYQRMIRNLLNEYKARMGGNDHHLST